MKIHFTLLLGVVCIVLDAFFFHSQYILYPGIFLVIVGAYMTAMQNR